MLNWGDIVTQRIFFERFTKILILQMIFISIIIIGITVIRYFFPDLYLSLKEIYTEYMKTEITLSLVLDGK